MSAVYQQFVDLFGIELTTRFEIQRQCGYDPMRLLSDQRSPEKKQADAMVAQYRDLYPDMLKAFYDRPLGEAYEPREKVFDWGNYASGGIFTGRFPTQPEIQYIKPQGEAILPKDHPMVNVDFGRIERRVLASYVIPKHILDVKVDSSAFIAGLDQAGRAVNRVTQAMKRMGEAVNRQTDRMLLLALYGDINLSEPEPGFSRERRIAKLLRSSDPRQRKRGNRLFNAWRRERKIANLKKGYSGK